MNDVDAAITNKGENSQVISSSSEGRLAFSDKFTMGRKGILKSFELEAGKNSNLNHPWWEKALQHLKSKFQAQPTQANIFF